ncbi:hypothetical protein [Alkalicoccus daliensis]|uniref:Uncharacterized protein n=1 Tax=Alkalicoccus daliensis TaxID=745820 RepID=A0A1H0GZZ0_9BACI|nr:hypothetical protein [Alkalicoccus daliensis]SDO12439.1 hypothetical protein SAMN04488053_107114 [Alkalicoccus daliensis]
MPRQKLLILGVGAAVLIALSTMLFLLDGDQQVIQNQDVNQNTPTASTTEDNTVEAEEAQNSGDSINIESGQNAPVDSLDADIQEELQSQAQEALDNYMPDERESFSREAFEDHALVYTYYIQQGDEAVIEEDAVESNAEWLAIELDGWNTYAEDAYGFTFDEARFQNYTAEEEEHTLEDDAELSILLEEMENESPIIAQQQLEFQYAKSFIWHEIQEDAAAEQGENPESVEEWNQVYFTVEQEVFEQIADDHPAIMDGEAE